MVIEGLGTKYTAEDKAGFYFGKPDAIGLAAEKKRQGAVLLIKAVLYGIIFVTLIIFGVCIALDVVTCDSPGLKKILLGILVLFAVVMLVPCIRILAAYRSRMKMIDIDNVKCIRIAVTEKLPEKFRSGIDSTSESYFYPVRGRDTTTGYESVCYVGAQQYEDANIGDVLCIYVYPEDLQ